MCIITASNHHGRILLTKTRDRAYEPRLRVCYMELRGVAIVLYVDLETGWLEGVNEHGIALVNSALMVKSDEKEHQKGKGGGARASKDGKAIFDALGSLTLEEAVQRSQEEPVIKGHTLITDGERLYHMEATSKHGVSVEALPRMGLHVYTNHGDLFPSAGYEKTTDPGYSTRHRQQSAQALLRHTQDMAPADLLDTFFDIGVSDEPKWYDMIRDHDNMHTTSQVCLDPRDKKLYLQLRQGYVQVIAQPLIQSERAAQILGHHMWWRG